MLRSTCGLRSEPAQMRSTKSGPGRLSRALSTLALNVSRSLASAPSNDSYLLVDDEADDEAGGVAVAGDMGASFLEGPESPHSSDDCLTRQGEFACCASRGFRHAAI